MMKPNQEAKNLIAMMALVAALVLTLNEVALAGDGRDTLPWSLGLLLVAIFFWIWMRRDALAEKREESIQAAEESASRAEELAKRTVDKSREASRSAETVARVSVTAVPTAPAPAPPHDDLTRISGIGGVFQGILQQAGISTFEQLATCSAEDLIEIFRATRYIRPPDIETWSQQAAYAARGDWDGLRAFRDAL